MEIMSNVSKNAMMVFSKDAVAKCLLIVFSCSYLGIDFSCNGAWDIIYI